MKKLVLVLGIVSLFGFSACSSSTSDGEEDIDDRNVDSALPQSEIPQDSNDEFELNLDNALDELDLVE